MDYTLKSVAGPPGSRPMTWITEQGFINWVWDVLQNGNRRGVRKLSFTQAKTMALGRGYVFEEPTLVDRMMEAVAQQDNPNLVKQYMNSRRELDPNGHHIHADGECYCDACNQLRRARAEVQELRAELEERRAEAVANRCTGCTCSGAMLLAGGCRCNPLREDLTEEAQAPAQEVGQEKYYWVHVLVQCMNSYKVMAVDEDHALQVVAEMDEDRIRDEETFSNATCAPPEEWIVEEAPPPTPTREYDSR